MAAVQANLPPLNSVQWLEYGPKFVYNNHGGQLTGKLLIYVSLLYTPGEMNEHVNKFRSTPQKVNTATKQLTKTISQVCYKHGISHIIWRKSFDETRAWLIAYDQGQRGEQLVNALKAHCAHEAWKDFVPSANPTIAELMSVKQERAPPIWFLTMARLIEEYPDLKQLQTAWGLPSIKYTQNKKSYILKAAEFIPDNILTAAVPDDGDANMADKAAGVVYEIFPANTYLKKRLAEIVAGDETEVVYNMLFDMRNPLALAVGNTAPPGQAMPQGSSKAAPKRKRAYKRKAIDQPADSGSSPKRNKPVVGPPVPLTSAKMLAGGWENYTAGPGGLDLLPQLVFNLPPTSQPFKTSAQRALEKGVSIDGFTQTAHTALSSASPTLALLEPAPVQAPSTLSPRDADGSSSSSPFGTWSAPPLINAASSSSSSMVPAPVPLQRGDLVSRSSSSTVSVLPRPEAAIRKNETTVTTAPAQPLNTRRGLFAGNWKQRAAIRALSHIMISLGPDKPAILTSPAALLTTFDPGHDKFKGLGETATTTAKFRTFCNTTTIFIGHTGGKNVDAFVAWVLDDFIYGPKLSGTFLTGFMYRLERIWAMDACRKVADKIGKKQEVWYSELITGGLG